MYTITFMKALFEKWRNRKKKEVRPENVEPEEFWLGGEAMIGPEVLRERKLKQKRKKK
jgi:hypothetical protein